MGGERCLLRGQIVPISIAAGAVVEQLGDAVEGDSRSQRTPVPARMPAAMVPVMGAVVRGRMMNHRGAVSVKARGARKGFTARGKERCGK